MHSCWTKAIALVATAGITLLPASPAFGQGSSSTATPIKHLVVIFQENVSFDHYFGTYPVAKNPRDEPAFTPGPNTPSVNGLTGGLLTANPNQFNPFRFDRSQAATCDQNHDYTPEQQAFDSGLMDKFPEFTGVGSTTTAPCPDYGHGQNLVMGFLTFNLAWMKAALDHLVDSGLFGTFIDWQALASI